MGGTDDATSSCGNAAKPLDSDSDTDADTDAVGSGTDAGDTCPTEGREKTALPAGDHRS